MLTMDDIKYIKRMYEVEGISMREIHRRTGYHMNTIKKYVEMEDFNQLAKKRKNNPSKLDPLKPIIDEWLKEDLNVPRKYRHTAKRVFTRLVEEYPDQLDVKLRTVQYYVSKRKNELGIPKPKAYLPLEHPEGEAQVDFCEILYDDENNERKKGRKLTMSFPQSNGAYFQVFKGENQECLLQGLKNIMKYLEKTPHTIVFDNPSTIVAHIGKGKKRTLTDGFERFMMHYQFNPVFCNPASGWEKGNIENKVGYERRNIFVPIPTIVDFNEFNKSLFIRAEKDMERQHYKKGKSINTLFENDLKAMKDINPIDFEVYKLVSAKADKYGKVPLDTNKYSTSPKFVSQRVSLKVTHDQVIPLDKDYNEIIRHDRIYDKEKESMKWGPYIDLISKRPNALKYTGFYKELPKNWQDYLSKLPREDKRDALLTLKQIIENNAMEDAVDSLAQALENGVSDKDSILASYYNLTKKIKKIEPLKLKNPSIKVPSYSFNAIGYDALLNGGVENAR